jgi:hypothetical protein
LGVDDAQDPQTLDDLASNLAQLDVDDDQSSELEYDYVNAYSELPAETPPEAPIYDTRVQAAVQNIKHQLRELDATLRKCALASDPAAVLKRLADQTKTLSEFEYPKTRVVGLVGESGVGQYHLTVLVVAQYS